ncbi:MULTISPECIES: prolyl aminopeptidase [unclassified Azospirillum]|uniref:prolyl aminopeptidase n=1 Tax=unclassified Azospirillum TaxID=2630922 RepID=UPI000B62540A|nr:MULTISPECIES: prolyl aminopeptidase [unclassified Azospirillum]SNS61636.1 prolyl aminopeptidase Serine peptidase. MEROPS family S33 [Azospirillum sp. RU38E]SNS80903.1 prolyl aminopeptidase Serine peptidase. MEROPS family S33 [Azospirillum sp. RU37A]
MPRGDLFFPLEPFQTGRLKVDDLHTLYWEQSGNPEGVPVLFLHGGPGAGASPTHRRFFDPTHYRIIILDQRGAGRSTPLGELRDNDIPHLVADLEQLREMLGIKRWLVFGGSWGSTLSIAYAQAHPDRVIGLILRGIFLMRQTEIDWFLYGMRQFFPEAWHNFVSYIPAAERNDLLEAYWKRLTHDNPSVRMQAARVWSMYEGACSTLLPSPELVSASGEDTHALGLARIEAHYFRNNMLTPEDKLLRDVDRIRHIPAVIIQGRYDVVCPINTADALHRAWPEADYIIVPDAGHSAMEPGIRTALVQATERFKTLR